MTCKVTRSFLVLAALALGACRPDYPLCKSDEHCKEHAEVCVEGQCRECAVDAQCKEGFVCKESQCAPKDECTADSHCPTGMQCKLGKCAAEMATVSGKVPCATDAQCGPGKVCAAGFCAEQATNVAGSLSAGPEQVTCSLQKIHFAFDDYTLDATARAELSRVAECIKKKQYTRLVIAGHADERGTEEYNLALGQKRAEAVKKYLADLGVDASGFQTLSWGEEKPAVQGTDEAAYRENRRAEFTEPRSDR